MYSHLNKDRQDEVVYGDVGGADSAQRHHGVLNLDLHVVPALSNGNARLEIVSVDVIEGADVDSVGAIGEVDDRIAVSEYERIVTPAAR